MQNDVEKGQDFETISLAYIKQAKSLVESINCKHREIQGIKKLKELNQSSESLKIIDSELNEADEKKHSLVTQLSAIRESTNEEFAYIGKIKSNQITNLEARIKGTHGNVKEYNQSSIKLSQIQNEYISIIQNNIEFEKILADHSEDKDLQDKAGTHLYYLYNDELGLQEKRREALEEKNELIKLNSHLHDKESSEKQFNENSADIESCKGRILLLKNQIKIKGKAFQNEEVEFITIGSLTLDNADSKSSEYEINSFYGQEEQLTVANPTTTQKSLSESEQLEQQREVLEVQRQKIIGQLNNKKLSSQDKSILLSELEGIELADKAKYDRLAELEKKKLEVSVDHNVKPQHVESTPKSTKEQDVVSTEVTKQSSQSTLPRQKLNFYELMEAKKKEVIEFWKTPLEELNKTPTTVKQSQQTSNTSSADDCKLKKGSLEELLKAKPKKAEPLKNSTGGQGAVSAKNPAFIKELNATLAKQALQGPSTFFGSGNSSSDKTKKLILVPKQLSQ